MNNLFLSIKNSPKFLAYPFIFVSSILIITNLLNVFPINAFAEIYLFFQNNLEVIFSFCAVYFVCYYTNDSKKAIASALAYALGDSVFYSLSNEHFSLFFGVVVAFVFSAIVKNLDLLYSFFLLLIISVIFGIIVGVSYDYLFSALKGFCKFMSKKQSLFGVVNNLYSVLFSDNFGDLFYTKDYSTASLVNDKLVAGVKNIFTSNPKSNISALSSFMTGKYFLNFFVTLGIFVALFSHFDGVEQLSFCMLLALSLVFGDIKLLSLFILVFNPMLYLGYLVMTFVCYLISALLDIRIGFVDNGSIVEFFKYGNNYGYVLLTGIVIGVMTYFVFKILIAKFDIQKRKLLPKEVRKIVNALGGEKNIQKIMNDKLIVKNPNLINVLALDCDIMQNEVTLHFGELELLKQFF